MAHKKQIRIVYRPTGTILVEGPKGWGVTPFEGNYYILSRYLKDGHFSSNYIPGICPYKFLFVWLNLELQDGRVVKSLGWYYWLPNPLLPFICFRVALPGSHPDLLVEEFSE